MNKIPNYDGAPTVFKATSLPSNFILLHIFCNPCNYIVWFHSEWLIKCINNGESITGTSSGFVKHDMKITFTLLLSIHRFNSNEFKLNERSS